jgi:hypothetical protein
MELIVETLGIAFFLLFGFSILFLIVGVIGSIQDYLIEAELINKPYFMSTVCFVGSMIVLLILYCLFALGVY